MGAGATKYTVALMCAEKEPLECHRAILVARHLVARGFDIQHITAMAIWKAIRTLSSACFVSSNCRKPICSVPAPVCSPGLTTSRNSGSPTAQARWRHFSPSTRESPPDENFHHRFYEEIGEDFFTRLQNAGVSHLVDVRLNNVSQLAGFTKRDDLRYFTKAICNIDYVHMPQLAPTAEILDPYKKQKNGDWDLYERQFLDLMTSRKIEEQIPQRILDGGCLLCSEEKPHHCHRRLVAEYLRGKWGNVEIQHIP